jgi:hypothetical protein
MTETIIIIPQFFPVVKKGRIVRDIANVVVPGDKIAGYPESIPYVEEICKGTVAGMVNQVPADDHKIRFKFIDLMYSLSKRSYIVFVASHSQLWIADLNK